MSNDDHGGRGRAEPIDVEFEPAEHHYRPGGGIGLGSALVLAVISAGAGAAGGAYAPRVPEIRSVLDKTLPDRNAPLSTTSSGGAQTAASLDARLDAIETIMNTPLSAAANANTDRANINARVFQMQAGLQDVQTRLSRMPSTEEVAQLVTEVQGLKQDLPAVAAQARTAVEAARAAFAVAAAAEASRSSGPFVQSYASLQALLPEDPNVVALEPLARTGAPTRSELREEFDRIDATIIRTARQANAGSGFWGRIQAFLADFIVIRQTGVNRLDTPDGVVEVANQQLDHDNLAGAVQTVNRLSGPARRVADPWLRGAQRRLDIDARIAAIRTELARRG